MQFEAGAHYAWRYTYPLRAIGREDDLRDRITVLADELEPSLNTPPGGILRFPLQLVKRNRYQSSCVATTLPLASCTLASTASP